MKKATVELAITQSQLKTPDLNQEVSSKRLTATLRASRLCRHSGGDGSTSTVEHLSNGAMADVEPQNKGAEILHRTSAVCLIAGHLGNDGGEARPIAAPVFLGDNHLVQLFTTDLLPFVEDEVDNMRFDLGKLDPLMGVVGGEILKIR